MGIFKPRAAKESNYLELELELYVNFVALQKTVQVDNEEKKYYFISSSDKTYRKGFNICYSLVKFYTKHREEKKEYQFKRNYLLAKTRGLYSNQKVKKSKLFEAYLVRKEIIDELANNYLKMFKIEKLYEKLLQEEKNKKES